MKTLALFVLISISGAQAQDSLRTADGFSQDGESSFRKTVATGTILGTLALSLVWAFDEWWEDDSFPFHFFHEGWFGDYSLGIDKAGHAFTSYAYFRTYRNIMLWGGYDESTAFWWATGTTAFFALSVEIGDGLSSYGFSYEDFAANLFGLGYGMLQTRVPFMRNFNLKWSYIPKPEYVAAAHFTRFYDAHTYWITANMHALLPSSWKTYWPEFLQLAVGYGVDNKQTRREGVIGFDFNLEIFPAPNNDILLLQKTVNMFHIPAPAVKFTQGKPPSYHLFHTN